MRRDLLGSIHLGGATSIRQKTTRQKATRQMHQLDLDGQVTCSNCGAMDDDMTTPNVIE